MELDNIEKLLEKYFEAATTVAEEQTLRAYFEGDEVAPHLQQYGPMFGYFSKARNERFTGQIPLTTRKNLSRWISVAAVAVLIFGIYLGKNYQEQQKAEYAYNQTKEALRLLAENLDRGTEKVAYLNEFEVTKQKILNNE
jgi:hypothetical protein